jgi:hypothetical protein
MSAATPQSPQMNIHPPIWQKVAAVLAMIFGAMTLFSAGSILGDFGSANQAAGDYVPFVLWFNFLAGFAYMAAAVGIWRARKWGCSLSVLIAAATGLVALIFAFVVWQGAAFEMRTVGALVLRFGVWAVIAIALYRRGARA